MIFIQFKHPRVGFNLLFHADLPVGIDLGQPPQNALHSWCFFFIVSQRSSRCPYTLLLIELPTPVPELSLFIFTSQNHNDVHYTTKGNNFIKTHYIFKYSKDTLYLIGRDYIMTLNPKKKKNTSTEILGLKIYNYIHRGSQLYFHITRYVLTRASTW